ncbi:hypothetical protein V6N12_033120 [Hibiscus sabdariffa]|uniref:EF-hand domain-containing protein n=1 Tax=Hibiscus sabdariffa TaxID=183260 RepID=A0ABR2BCV1_9ROSI
MEFSRHNSSHSAAPSAPELPPESYDHHQQHQYQSYYGNPSPPLPSSSYGQSGGFPAGTQPGVVRAFQMVDRDRSGFIDEHELQQALSSGYQRFNLRTMYKIAHVLV